MIPGRTTRLMGHVHHDARGSDRVYLAGLRLLFLLDDTHRFSPPDPSPGPGVFLPTLGGGLLLGAWALTVLVRRWNRSDRRTAFYSALGIA